MAAGVIAVGLALVGPSADASPPSQRVEQGSEVYCSGRAGEVSVELAALFDVDGVLSDWGGVVRAPVGQYWASEASGSFVAGVMTLSVQVVTEQDDAAGALQVQPPFRRLVTREPSMSASRTGTW